jgi:hypothetical protein
MTRVCAVLGTLVLVCTMATPAQAIPITEQTLIVTGGDPNELFLDGSFGDGVGDIFYTGPGSQNLDGMVNAMNEDVSGQVVGFEDLFGGGDNDLVFAFTNVTPAAGASGAEAITGAAGSGESVGGGGSGAGVNVVDEPSSLMMFGFGLVALVFAMKRQAVKR